MKLIVVLGFLCTTLSINNAQYCAPPASGKTATFDESLLDQFLALTKGGESYQMCTVCQDVFSTLKQIATDPESRIGMTNMLTKFCSTVQDKTEQKLCTAFIADKLPTLIDFLFTRFDADSACTRFDMCPKTNQIEPKETDPVTLPPAEINDIICAGCTWVLNFVEYGVLNQDSGNALGYVTARFCETYVGNPDEKDKCLTLAQNLCEVLPLIHDFLPSTKVCAKAKLCPASS